MPFPNVGGDSGAWGDELNALLGVAHNADGSLIPAAVEAALGGPLTFYSGSYYTTPGSVATATRPDQVATASPLLVQKTATFDRIAVEVTTVGAAGSTISLGIYNDNGGTPGALNTDAGTVAGDGTTGVKTITISVTLTPGLYWLSARTNTGGTAPTCRAYTSGQHVLGAPLVATNFSAGVGWSKSFAGTAGLPDPFSASGVSDTCTLVALRAA